MEKETRTAVLLIELPIEFETQAEGVRWLPEERHASWIYGDDEFQKGWNSCIREILGEER